MRPQSPISGVPDASRYRGNGAADTPDRYGALRGRGDAGVYVTLPTTLEEEAQNGGWLPGALPSGPPPRRLFTLGMRGDNYDDDPSPDNTNSYRQGGGSGSDSD